MLGEVSTLELVVAGSQIIWNGRGLGDGDDQASGDNECYRCHCFSKVVLPSAIAEEGIAGFYIQVATVEMGLFVRCCI